MSHPDPENNPKYSLGKIHFGGKKNASQKEMPNNLLNMTSLLSITEYMHMQILHIYLYFDLAPGSKSDTQKN